MTNPLLQLWNYIRGQSSAVTLTDQQVATMLELIEKQEADRLLKLNQWAEISARERGQLYSLASDILRKIKDDAAQNEQRAQAAELREAEIVKTTDEWNRRFWDHLQKLMKQLDADGTTSETPGDGSHVAVIPDTNQGDTPWPYFETGTVRDMLGVNYTGASNKLIESESPMGAAFAHHSRYFLDMADDYGDDGSTPADKIIMPCTNFENPWKCSDETEIVGNLVRIKSLLQMHPGLCFIAPEVTLYRPTPDTPDSELERRDWAFKSWTAAELSGIANPSPGEQTLEHLKLCHQAGYGYANAYLDSFIAWPTEFQERIVLMIENEEFEPVDMNGDDRRAAHDEWRKGFCAAHKAHRDKGGLVQIGTGARDSNNRLRGSSDGDYYMTESWTDYPKEVNDYIAEADGWFCIHVHPEFRKDYDFETYQEVSESGANIGGSELKDELIRELMLSEPLHNLHNFADSLREEYGPTVRIAATEISTTLSPVGVVPSEQFAQETFWIEEALLGECIRLRVLAMKYQIEDHSGPEGKFSGTGAALVQAQLKEFSERDLNESDLNE